MDYAPTPPITSTSKKASKSVMPVPELIVNKIRDPLNPYIPVKYVSYGPYKMINGFHVGVFEAFCPLSNTFNSYACYDFGQYPWGHSTVRGCMADICKRLGIGVGSDARNTCLPLHVFTGIIENDITSIDELIGPHGKFVKSLLNSQYMRDGYPTLDRIFSVLDLKDKACLRFIDKIEYRSFTLLDRYFGTLGKKTIYIVHVPWHFFIAKRLDF